MRKNSSAWRYCRFASKYCRIAGVTVPDGAAGVAGDVGNDTEGEITNNKEQRTNTSVLLRYLLFVIRYFLADPGFGHHDPCRKRGRHRGRSRVDGAGWR